MAKIGSVTVEIFLILTNVARAYVASTNVTMTVGTFKRGPKILPSKFGKNGSVTVDMFLIWTNAARTNVAWTNVILTVC